MILAALVIIYGAINCDPTEGCSEVTTVNVKPRVHQTVRWGEDDELYGGK